MVTKHFFKILTIFASMIIVGLIVLLAIDYFSNQPRQATNVNNQTNVAK